MKIKHVVIIVFLILLLDQGLKFYIKLNFQLGEEVNVLGSWFRLHFIENSGMAFGMKFGEDWGKLALSLFRMVAVVWGFFFIKNKLVGKGYPNALLICAAMILAGAFGNLIDSLLYGNIFTASTYHSNAVAQMVPWGQGYAPTFYGKVVDMLYFPLFVVQWPEWVPMIGGNTFEFFRPVFNVADASIFLGVISILLFQRSLLDNGADLKTQTPTETVSAEIDTEAERQV